MSMLMKDDYDVASLLVKRLPVGTCGGAVMVCKESYYKKNHDIPWEELEVVHDRRSHDGMYEIEVIKVEGVEVLAMYPQMLAYLNPSSPFVMWGDERVAVVGVNNVRRLRDAADKLDPMGEIKWRDGIKLDEMADLDSHICYYILRDHGDYWNNTSSKVKNSIKPYEINRLEVKMKGLGLEWKATFSQRLSFFTYMMYRPSVCTDFFVSDGAIMYQTNGMWIGIEPDGYRHS
jgi:hypothetical protein